MRADAGEPVAELRVDGGASRSDLLMQFQADLLGAPVVRPAVTETTALGAAYLAGLAVDYWRTPEEIAAQRVIDRRFEPAMDPATARELRANWNRAVERARGWAQ
jgi:glycerol kinase